MSQFISYRSDIDGLRALAVLGVLLYHVDLSLISGGFTGVDVFFVISGYLITKIIYNQQRSGSFSLRKFYIRRARRLLPALFVMLLLSLLITILFFSPKELFDASKSAVSATFSLSNIWFYSQAGYFDAEAKIKPFLHTWSLGVEEQFYLVWPVLLIFCLKLKGIRFAIFTLALIAIFSFSANIYMVTSDPEQAFFLSHLRAWEFAIGALVVVLEKYLKHDRFATLIFLVGITFILGSFVYIDSSLRFPGWVAIFPVLGAACLILSADKTKLGFLLNNSLMVFVGKISYSLYLYHWPVMVIYGKIIRSELTFADAIVVVGISFVLSIISFFFVENVFRSSKTACSEKENRKGTKYKSIFIFSLPILVMLTCGFIWLNDGFVRQLPENIASIAEGEKYDPSEIYRRYKCFVMDDIEDFSPADCVMPQDPDKPNILLVGDSHAAHLWYGLDSVFDDYNVLQATSASCHALKGYSVDRWASCRSMMDLTFNELIFIPNTVVFLASKWNKNDFKLLSETINLLNNKNIPFIILGPTISYHGTLPSRIVEYGKVDGLDEYLYRYLRKHRHWDGVFAEKMRDFGAEGNYISIYDAVCKPAYCPPLNEDLQPLQYDNSHLTMEGSLFVGRKLHKAIIEKFGKNLLVNE